MSTPALRPRTYGPVNWLGLYTLTMKEIRRFTKVNGQTIVAPVITTLLFYLVFDIALGGEGRMIVGVPYMAFLAPGLIMMSMAQNAFANTSSSIVISKVQGNIVDVLMPPLSPLEFTLGYTLGAIARGMFVGAVSITTLAFLLHVTFAHPLYILYYAFMGSMMLGLLGMAGGIWAQKFDQLASVQNYIVMPATFLSGTFYTAKQLPALWHDITHFNPFFYMIDGFRYGFIDQSDGTLGTGLVVLAVTNTLLFLLCWRMVASGYKLKS